MLFRSELRELVELDTATGAVRVLDQPLTYVESFATDGRMVTAFGESPTQPGANIAIDLATHQCRQIAAKPAAVDAQWLPRIHSVTASGPEGRLVHAIVHEPTHPELGSPDCAPTIITAHGGPTGHSTATTALNYAYFT